MTRSDHFVSLHRLRIPRMLLLNLVLGLSAMAATLLFWWATELRGIGVQPGMVPPLWAAESLSRGLGYTMPDVLGGARQVSEWPPLYSALLSAVLSIQAVFNPAASVDGAARLLGALLTGVGTLVFGGVAARVSSRSVSFVMIGMLVLLSSPPFWETYLYATSEPLLICLCLLCLYHFLDHLRTFSNSSLFLTGLTLGLGVLTGTLALFLLPVMGMVNFYFTNRTIRRKILTLSHLLAMGLLPSLLWELWENYAAGASARLRLVFAPISAAEWGRVWVSLLDWFNPLVVVLKNIPVGLGFILAFSLLIGSLIAYYRKRVYGNNESGEMWWKILILYMLSYGVLVLADRVFLEPGIVLTASRVFLPGYMGLVLLVQSLLSNAREIRFQVLNRAIFYAAFATVLIFIAMMTAINLQESAFYLTSARAGGLGLNGAANRNRALWAGLQELVPQAHDPIYVTDDPQALYWLRRAPSVELGGLDAGLEARLQPYRAGHDLLIVLANTPGANTEIKKYLPAAQEYPTAQDGALFILRREPAN